MVHSEDNHSHSHSHSHNHGHGHSHGHSTPKKKLYTIVIKLGKSNFGSALKNST